MTKEEENRGRSFAAVREQLASWDGFAGDWYWLSFCDPDLPAGNRFIGASIVYAPNIMAAPAVAHMLGCNPGGEIAIRVVPKEFAAKVGDQWKDRILSRDDITELDNEMAITA